MTWVSAGEVGYIIRRRWGMERMQAALAMLEATAIEIVPVDRQLALRAAHIKAEHPIAYADAFAAALALAAGARLVTGDPEFERLSDNLSIHWLPRRAG
jgi:ribonuclease VapC